MGTSTDALRRDLEHERNELTNDLQVIGDRVSPGRMVERRKAATRQRFTQMREQVMGTADHMRNSATNAGDSTSGAISNAASSVKDAMQAAPERAEHAVEGNPLGAGLAAFGVGLVLATLLPESQTEQRLAARVEPKLDEAASALGSAAQQVVGQVKPAAADAVQQLKDEAKDAASQVKDQARSAAPDTAEQAKEKAQQVREQAKQ